MWLAEDPWLISWSSYAVRGISSFLGAAAASSYGYFVLLYKSALSNHQYEPSHHVLVSGPERRLGWV